MWGAYKGPIESHLRRGSVVPNQAVAQCCGHTTPPPPPPVRGQKKCVYQKSPSTFRLFDRSHFPPEENFSEVGGGGGGRPGLARAPKPLPPPGHSAMAPNAKRVAAGHARSAFARPTPRRPPPPRPPRRPPNAPAAASPSPAARPSRRRPPAGPDHAPVRQRRQRPRHLDAVPGGDRGAPGDRDRRPGLGLGTVVPVPAPGLSLGTQIFPFFFVTDSP